MTQQNIGLIKNKPKKKHYKQIVADKVYARSIYFEKKKAKPSISQIIINYYRLFSALHFSLSCLGSTVAGLLFDSLGLFVVWELSFWSGSLRKLAPSCGSHPLHSSAFSLFMSPCFDLTFLCTNASANRSNTKQNTNCECLDFSSVNCTDLTGKEKPRSQIN